MNRRLLTLVLALTLCTASLQAQEGPQRGKIKKVTAQSITVTVDGKDVECTLAPNMRFMSAANEALSPPLEDKGVKAGAAVMFLARPRDGQSVLVGLKLLPAGGAGGPGGIRRGKIKTLDVDHKTLSLTVDGKVEEFQLTDDTQVLGSPGNDLASGCRGSRTAVRSSSRPTNGTASRPSWP